MSIGWRFIAQDELFQYSGKCSNVLQTPDIVKGFLLSTCYLNQGTVSMPAYNAQRLSAL